MCVQTQLDAVPMVSSWDSEQPDEIIPKKTRLDLSTFKENVKTLLYSVNGRFQPPLKYISQIFLIYIPKVNV